MWEGFRLDERQFILHMVSLDMVIVGQILELSYRYSARLGLRDTCLMPQAQSLYYERFKDG